MNIVIDKMNVYIGPRFIEPLDGLKLNFIVAEAEGNVLKPGGRSNCKIVKAGGLNQITAMVHKSLSGPRVVMKGKFILIYKEEELI